MISTVLLILIAVIVCTFGLSYFSARRLAVSSGHRLHSLPTYHGGYVALWAALPSFLLLLVWLSLQGPVIDRLALSSLPDAMTENAGPGQRNLLLSEIKSVADGVIFGEPDPQIAKAADLYNQWHSTGDWAMAALVIGLSAFAAYIARSRISVHFRARQRVERIVNGLMIGCSVIAILTTLGIVLSLLFEAFRFFAMVSPLEFFFGLNWEPQIAMRADQVAGAGAFGAIPVFTGTLLIAGVAMLIAGPIGLLSAIYLSEYANHRVRAVVKPALELLAGIPTVVYGFFAVLVIAPAITDFGRSIGIGMAPNSAIAAGFVMGIMLIPFVSSLADDALGAVPHTMRDGSFGLGATKAETITNVLIPSALPGITGGLLLAASRAIGETMIVVMAAGLIANMTANPFEAVTTVTVQIVTLLIGDTEFDSPKTLAAFALGLVLFVVTLCMNVLALRIVQKYREKYD